MIIQLPKIVRWYSLAVPKLFIAGVNQTKMGILFANRREDCHLKQSVGYNLQCPYLYKRANLQCLTVGNCRGLGRAHTA